MPRKTKTAAPMLDSITLPELTPGAEHDLHPGTEIEGVGLVDLTLDDLDLESSSIIICSLSGIRSAETNLQYATLAESVLDRLDLPVVRGMRGRWRDVEIRGTRLGAAELFGSAWDSVHLVGCKLGYVNLRGAELRDVVFTDCTVDELDLGQATLERVAFRETRVARLDLQGATLKHVDLRGAELREIGGVASMSGATISEQQLVDLAPLLAAERGILVAP